MRFRLGKSIDMATRKYPAPPIHSEDPTDWFMYSDILQDAGASRPLWKSALRTAQSLQRSSGLYLLWFQYGNPVGWEFPYSRQRCSTVSYAWFPEWWLDDQCDISGRYRFRDNSWFGTIARPGSDIMASVLKWATSPIRCQRSFFTIHSRPAHHPMWPLTFHSEFTP